MATGVNFVEVTGAANAAFLNGTAVVNAPYLVAVDPTSALNLFNATPSNPAITARNGVVVDRVVFDPALTAVPPGVGTTFASIGTYIGGYAKNGAVMINFNGTNAQTLNLTNTALVTPAATAGDTVFSNAGAILINNLGPAAVTISTVTGANGANLPTMTTTNGSVTVPSGSVALYHANPVVAVDATHKNIVITPVNTTTVAITVCGN